MDLQRATWNASVENWEKQHSLTEGFREAEQALQANRIPLSDAPSYERNEAREAKLAEAFHQLAACLQSDQPLSTKTAWTLWPLVNSQDQKIRHLACKTLQEHHHDLCAHFADGQQRLVSSVLIGVRHPLFFPRLLKTARTATAPIPLESVSAEGFDTLQKIWAGAPLTSALTDTILETADFFGCDELLSPRKWVETLNANLTPDIQLRLTWGQKIILSTELSSDAVAEKLLQLSQFLSQFHLPVRVVFRMETGHGFPSRFHQLLQKEDKGFFSEIEICGHLPNQENCDLIWNALNSYGDLRILDFRYAGLETKGVCALADAIAEHPGLQELNLPTGPIDPKAVKQLAEALKKNKALKVLDLSHRNLNLTGCKALAEALKQNTSLESLNLTQCHIGPNEAKALGKGLEANTTLQRLNIDCNQIDTRGVRALGAWIEKSPAVQHLSLAFCHIGIKGATILGKALQKNRSLQSLNLCCNDISNFSFKKKADLTPLATGLANHPNLRSLNLSQNRFFWATGEKTLMEAVQESRTLERLILSDMSLGIIEAGTLTNALKENTPIKALNIDHNEMVVVPSYGLAIASALERNTHLERLSLRDVMMGPMVTEAIGAALAKNTTLQSLCLSDSTGVKILCSALKENSSLRLLDLEMTKITQEEAVELAAALEQNSGLKKTTLWIREGRAEASAIFQPLMQAGKLEMPESTTSLITNGDVDGVIVIDGVDEFPSSLDSARFGGGLVPVIRLRNCFGQYHYPTSSIYGPTGSE